MNDTKQRSVILITHDNDDKDDRASLWLKSQGYRLDWCCPAEGDAIPPITDDVAGAVIYGGKYDVGEQTRDAIRQFERDRHLPITGDVTEALMAELAKTSGTSQTQTP